MRQIASIRIKRAKDEWNGHAGKVGKRQNVKFTTVSGELIETLYTPDDIQNINYLSDIGFPGEFPYTRGIHRNMYPGEIMDDEAICRVWNPRRHKRRIQSISWNTVRQDCQRHLTCQP